MANELNQKTNLKKLDLQGGISSFEANGKTYHIESTMSIERYTLFQQYELELSYNLSFKQLFETFKKVYELLNQSKPADASVLIYNTMQGFAKLEQKEPYVMKYCALFINEEAEDRRVITEDMITAKINDWQKEGIAFESFLQLAIFSIPSFIENWKAAHPDTLQKK